MAAIGNQQQTYAAFAGGEQGFDFIINQCAAVGLQVVGTERFVEAIHFVAIGVRLVSAVAGIGDDQAVALGAAGNQL